MRAPVWLYLWASFLSFIKTLPESRKNISPVVGNQQSIRHNSCVYEEIIRKYQKAGNYVPIL